MDNYETAGVRIDGKICSPRAEPMNPEYWTAKKIKRKLGMQPNGVRSKRQLCKDLLDYYSTNVTTLLDEPITASAILGQHEDLRTACTVLPLVSKAVRISPRLQEICGVSFDIDVEVLSRQPAHEEYLWSTQVKYTTDFAIGIKRRVQEVLQKISEDHPIFGPLRITHSFFADDSTYIVLGRSKGNGNARNSKFTGFVKHDEYRTRVGPTDAVSPEML